MDFNKLNSQAFQAQYSLAKQMGEDIFNAKEQNEKFIEALTTYLEPHVEEVANKVIQNNGEAITKIIDATDFVQSYEKTDYILATFKNRFIKDMSPLFEMTSRLTRYVERAYHFKFPAFEIYIVDKLGIKSATDITCEIKIQMTYRKYFDYERTSMTF